MKIILFGANGAVGKIICSITENTDCEIVAKVDAAYEKSCGNCYKKISDYTGEADVIVDFSYHGAINDIMQYATERKIPAVIATTGHTPEEKAVIENAAKNIPVFYAGNYSVGIALLCDLTRKAVEVMEGAEVEIVEVHHNRKIDAPSGTALMLYESVKAVRPEAKAVCGRNGQAKREKGDVGINSIRIGNVVGIHEVIISTGTQTVKLTHEAHDRALFAEGALKAAEYLIGKPAKIYSMQEMLAGK